MTKEEVTALAHKAGLHLATDVHWMPIIDLAYAEKFAALVAEHERKMFFKEIAMLHDSWMLASVPGHLSTKGLRIKE